MLLWNFDPKNMREFIICSYSVRLHLYIKKNRKKNVVKAWSCLDFETVA